MHELAVQDARQRCAAPPALDLADDLRVRIGPAVLELQRTRAVDRRPGQVAESDDLDQGVAARGVV